MYVLAEQAHLICESVSVISGTSYWFNYENTSSVKSTKQTNYMLYNRYSIPVIMFRPALSTPAPTHRPIQYAIIYYSTTFGA
jgi:hypothetical protein